MPPAQQDRYYRGWGPRLSHLVTPGGLSGEVLDLRKDIELALRNVADDVTSSGEAATSIATDLQSSIDQSADDVTAAAISAVDALADDVSSSLDGASEEAAGYAESLETSLQADIAQAADDVTSLALSEVDSLRNKIAADIVAASQEAAGYAATVEENLQNEITQSSDDLRNLLGSEVGVLNDRINKVYDPVQTNDATLTDIATITIPQYRSVLLEVRIHAQRTDRLERAVYTIEALCRAVPSFGTLTVSGVPTDGDQIEIDSVVYTAKTVLTPLPYEVLIGGSAANFIANLAAAITNTGTPGTDYADNTPIHPSVTARGATASTMQAVAKVPGVAGDSITTTDPVDTGTVLSWGGATLASGSDMTVTKILDRDDVEDDATWDKDLVAGTGHSVDVQGQGAAGKDVNWLVFSRATEI